MTPRRPSPPSKPVYRGVSLQMPAHGRTCFSLAQLKKAVETAVATNADALSARSELARARPVFINRPFDAEYKPLFLAICFTILACG